MPDKTKHELLDDRDTKSENCPPVKPYDSVTFGSVELWLGRGTQSHVIPVISFQDTDDGEMVQVRTTDAPALIEWLQRIANSSPTNSPREETATHLNDLGNWLSDPGVTEAEVQMYFDDAQFYCVLQETVLGERGKYEGCGDTPDEAIGDALLIWESANAN